MRSTALLALAAALCMAQGARATSNYINQTKSVFYSAKDGLPTQGTLNGSVVDLDDLSPAISLNKTEAELNCASGYMSVKLK